MSYRARDPRSGIAGKAITDGCRQLKLASFTEITETSL